MSMKATKRYRQTPKGVLTNMYHKQIERCLKYGRHLPVYTLGELHERFLDDDRFLAIHKAWVEGGFQYYDIPSIDRRDPNKGYSMDNIQVMTWGENREKGDKENAKRFTTPIVMFDRDGNKIREFESLKEAATTLNISQGLISLCCKGKRNHTRGFVFKYRGDKFRKNPKLLQQPTG